MNTYILKGLAVLGGLATAFFSTQAQATPIKDFSSLDSISFWERTGGTSPTEYNFSVTGAELSQQLPGTLSSSNNDFTGIPGHEFYDVYYSNSDGTFNINGEYLSIEGFFDGGLPAGGGLNLAAINLNFSSGTPYALDYVASFVALGDNADPSSVVFSIDGDYLTNTTMGNTIGTNQRLRITLGIQGPGPNPVPEPASMLLFGIGIAGLAGIKMRRRKK